jgi:hypothetical protein
MLPFFVKVDGAIAKRLCTGLQIRLAQFDSGSRLQENLYKSIGYEALHQEGFVFCASNRLKTTPNFLESVAMLPIFFGFVRLAE